MLLKSIKLLILIFGLFLSAVTTAGAQTAEEQYARQLTDQIADALAAEDAEEALALISSYHQLGIAMPPSIYIAEGNALLLKQDNVGAIRAYNHALSSSKLSNLDRVRTRDRIRGLRKLVEEQAELDRLKAERRSEVFLRLKTSFDELLVSLTLSELIELLESLDNEQRKEVLKLQYEHDGMSGRIGYHPSFSIFPYLTYGSGVISPARGLFLQEKVLCESDSFVQERAFSVLFGDRGSGMNSDLANWLSDPLLLPQDCWNGWNRLLRWLEVDPTRHIYKLEGRGLVETEPQVKRNPILWNVDGSFDLGMVPGAFMYMEYLEERGYFANHHGNAITLNIAGDRIDGKEAALVMLVLRAPTHHDFLTDDASEQQQQINFDDLKAYYTKVTEIYVEKFDSDPNQIRRRRSFLTSGNCTTIENILYWSAAQSRGLQFSDGEKECLVRTMRNWPSVPNLFLQEYSSSSFDSEGMMFVLEFLEASGVNWNFPIRNVKGGPQISALEVVAHTGDCVAYKKLREYGARYRGSKAREIIRQYDPDC